MASEQSGREKVKRAAMLSVLAALILTLLKLVVGFATNSLGVISEALHSGLDMVAAGITLIAVQRASRQPDTDHPYGHGKIENFAALAETILLWITAGWILFEAFRRIAGEEFADPNIWGIAVMLVSILIDYERSQMLYKTAKEFDSQALEADALHFRTDMLSSIVVLIGLIFVYFGFLIGDPLSAIGVSLVIFYVSYNLGKRSFDFLIDRAPEGIREEVQEVCKQIPGIVSCRRVRARTSGPNLFLDIVVMVDETVTTGEAHHIADSIESELSKLATNVDVVVHIEPAEIDSEQYDKMNIYDQLQVLGRREKDIQSVHNIRVFSMKDGIELAAGLEMSPNLTLQDAHNISERVEKDIKKLIPKVKSVTLHMETSLVEGTASDITAESKELVQGVHRIIGEVASCTSISSVVVRKEKDGLSLLIECGIVGSMPLAASHDISDNIEKRIRESFPDVSKVFIHLEPL
ncbi:MAG: cation-efflux pump [Candidatus Thorarchaeota archaeon]